MFSFPFLGERISTELKSKTIGSSFALKAAHNLLISFKDTYKDDLSRKRDLLLLQYPEEECFIKNLTISTKEFSSMDLDVLKPEIAQKFLGELQTLS